MTTKYAMPYEDKRQQVESDHIGRKFRGMPKTDSALPIGLYWRVTYGHSSVYYRLATGSPAVLTTTDEVTGKVSIHHLN